MKKLILLCIVVLAFSCSSDDDAASYSSSDLVGTWVLLSTSVNGVIDEPSECSQEVIFTKTTLKNKEYYGDNCEQFYDSESKSYSVSGKTLSVDDYKAEILELTSKTFKLKGVLDESDVKITIIQNFKKK